LVYLLPIDAHSLVNERTPRWLLSV